MTETQLETLIRYHDGQAKFWEGSPVAAEQHAEWAAQLRQHQRAIVAVQNATADLVRNDT